MYAFLTSDGNAVVSSTDQQIEIDRCDACRSTADLLALARTRVTRNLTAAERSTFLGANPAKTSDSYEAGLMTTTDRPVVDGSLPAGAYRAVGIDPGLSFTVPGGWQLTTFLHQRPADETPVGVVVQLQRLDSPGTGFVIAMLDPGRVIDSRKGPDERRNVEPFPRDFPSWLASQPYVTVSHPRHVQVGGHRGVQFDTEVTSTPSDWWGNCGGPCVTILTYSVRNPTGPLTDGDGVNVLGPGEVDRWTVVRVGDRRFLLDAFASSRSDLRSFMTSQVRPIVQSMQFGDQSG